MAQHLVARGGRQIDAIAHGVAQHQLAIAEQIDVDDLNVRLGVADVITLGERVAHAVELVVGQLEVALSYSEEWKGGWGEGFF